MNQEGRRYAAFAIAAVAIGGIVAVRMLNAAHARRVSECRALTRALDKTVRARSPRFLEGIVESYYQQNSGRCLASLEYHYKPCDKILLKKTPDLCAGPDADIAVYTFLNAEAHPLFICERTYAPAEAHCTESIYGTDGSLLQSREFPPDQFPAIKAELINPKP